MFMADSAHVFGVPITKGKLISKTVIGFIVSFNLEHLLLERLLGAQLYSKDQQPLSLMVRPTTLTNIYQYPLILNSPNLAIVQKEYTAIVFVKFRDFTPDLRIVFWFKRIPQKVENDYDFIDLPDKYVPLLIALSAKEAYLDIGKPIPSDLEEEIRKGMEEMEKDGNYHNYFIEDTFNLSEENLNKMSKESNKKLIEWKKSKQEFCHYVNDEYDKHKELHKNRRDAVNKIFERYSFDDKKWNGKRCYDLCLQLLRK